MSVLILAKSIKKCDRESARQSRSYPFLGEGAYHIGGGAEN